MEWVRHLRGPGRLYDPGEALGVVYFALLSASPPEQTKTETDLKSLPKDQMVSDTEYLSFCKSAAFRQ